jgi:hypothetical protein
MFTSSSFANDTILKWDVRSGTDFTSMFQNATNFTTNLRYWNITSGAVLTNMFDGTGTANGGIETLGGSSPDTTPLYTFFNKITIILNGTNPVTHERTQKYRDAGATTLTGEIPFISSNTFNADVVNPNTTPYEITYTAENSSRFDSGVEASTETRTINVVDTISPVITLTGSSIVTLERGDIYTDDGATASEGATVTNDIATAINDGTKNFTIGTYYITYTATDTATNTGTNTRTINVVDTTPPVITFPVNNIDLGGNGIKNYNGSSKNNPLIFYSDRNSGISRIIYSNGSSTDDATAEDLPGEDLTANMTSNIGELDLVSADDGSFHYVLYDVSDAAGNPAQAERIIKVKVY